MLNNHKKSKNKSKGLNLLKELLEKNPIHLKIIKKFTIIQEKRKNKILVIFNLMLIQILIIRIC